jgi:hypothetical protein
MIDSIWKSFSDAILQKDNSVVRALSLKKVSCMMRIQVETSPIKDFHVPIDTFLKRLLWTKPDSKFFSVIKSPYHFLPFYRV